MHLTMILGGPGCGKTTRLLRVVDGHLKSGASPSRVGFFAFTRKAAQEAKSRACETFKLTDDDLPYFRTIHSFAFKELNLSRQQVMSPEHYKDIGFELKLSFGDTEIYPHISKVAKELNSDKRFANSILEEISRL